MSNKANNDYSLSYPDKSGAGVKPAPSLLLNDRDALVEVTLPYGIIQKSLKG